jgi:hypothetical protein
MKVILISLLLSISSFLISQTKYEPFSGGIELGVGVSTIIDFNPINNGIHFPYIPYQAGLFVTKYLHPEVYLEFGIKAARHPSSFLHPPPKDDGYNALIFYNIDLPTKVYKKILANLKGNIFGITGLIPSLIMFIDQGAYDENIINNNYFRKFYLSPCIGAGFNKENLRFQMQFSSSIISTINPKYLADLRSENPMYKNRIYPCEIILLFGYVFS